MEGMAVALVCCGRLRAWWSNQSRSAVWLRAGGSGFGLCDGSDLGTCLLVRWLGPDTLAVCRAHLGLAVGSFAPVFSFIYC